MLLSQRVWRRSRYVVVSQTGPRANDVANRLVRLRNPSIFASMLTEDLVSIFDKIFSRFIWIPLHYLDFSTLSGFLPREFNVRLSPKPQLSDHISERYWTVSIFLGITSVHMQADLITDAKLLKRKVLLERSICLSLRASVHYHEILFRTHTDYHQPIGMNHHLRS